MECFSLFFFFQVSSIHARNRFSAHFISDVFSSPLIYTPTAILVRFYLFLPVAFKWPEIMSIIALHFSTFILQDMRTKRNTTAEVSFRNRRCHMPAGTPKGANRVWSVPVRCQLHFCWSDVTYIALLCYMKPLDDMHGEITIRSYWSRIFKIPSLFWLMSMFYWRKSTPIDLFWSTLT